MLTDVPPRKANRARFLESDRIRTLDLPQDGRLPTIAKSIESAMTVGQSAVVLRACAAAVARNSEISTRFQSVVSECLQRDRYEYVKAGRLNCSGIISPRQCSSGYG